VIRAFLWLAYVACLSTCLAWSSAASADDVRPFRYDARLEGTLVTIGAATWIASELLKPVTAPTKCRLCGSNALDASVQDGLRWRQGNRRKAQNVAHALLFGIVPIATAGTAAAAALDAGSRRDALVDTMVILESFLLTAHVTALAKFSVARRRPFVREGSAEQRDVLTGPQEDNVSFFSGHTSSTFSLAVAAGTTASLRGYRRAPLVWAVGLPLALLTGYFSIAADRHYFTDVLTGALVGSAIGVLVPWLHARGQSASMPTVSSGAPGGLTFSWTR
jgi:membrane-associated phospholipid phosphatase